jgi:purine-binding chemotaxis protein CheW
MSEKLKLVLIIISQRRYALLLSVVDRIIPVVDIAPLPAAPEIIAGLINIEGQPLPVFDLRKMLCLPAREVELSDRLVIARAANRLVALLADEVVGIIECSQHEIVVPQVMLPELAHVAGIITLDNEIVLIHNLEKFLTVAQANVLDEAMRSR